MSSKANKITVTAPQVSPWMIIIAAIGSSMIISAVVLVGLLRMQGLLQIAVFATALVMIVLLVTLSITWLGKLRQAR